MSFTLISYSAEQEESEESEESEKMTKREKLLHAIYLPIVVLLIGAVIALVCVAPWDREEEIDPLEYYNGKCESFRLQNANLSQGQIVFIGDSITDLYPLDDYYAELELATYNRGISGDVTQGVLDRLEVSLFDLKPSKIVLLIGTNDINWSVDPSTLLENYDRIITTIRERLPQTELYCVSIIPQNEMLERYSAIDVDQTTPVIMAVNEQIRKLAQERENVTYVDLFSQLSDEGNRLIEAYSDDGLHLNQNGFAVWTNLIKPYLK